MSSRRTSDERDNEPCRQQSASNPFLEALDAMAEEFSRSQDPDPILEAFRTDPSVSEAAAVLKSAIGHRHGEPIDLPPGSLPLPL